MVPGLFIWAQQGRGPSQVAGDAGAIAESRGHWTSTGKLTQKEFTCFPMTDENSSFQKAHINPVKGITFRDTYGWACIFQCVQ
jgi:hypothetical protein